MPRASQQIQQPFSTAVPVTIRGTFPSVAAPAANGIVQGALTGLVSGGTVMDLGGGALGTLVMLWAKHTLRRVEEPWKPEIIAMKVEKETLPDLDRKVNAMKRYQIPIKEAERTGRLVDRGARVEMWNHQTAAENWRVCYDINPRLLPLMEELRTDWQAYVDLGYFEKMRDTAKETKHQLQIRYNGCTVLWKALSIRMDELLREDGIDY